jgi:hypothetical protein
MLPLTHAWSRAQRCLLIAAVLIALAAFGTLVYSVERRYRLPDGNILAGTWEMTAPYSKDVSTVLRLDPERSAAWHSGAWVRYPTAGQQGYSEMWYAGGRYIYMHFEKGSPQPRFVCWPATVEVMSGSDCAWVCDDRGDKNH